MIIGAISAAAAGSAMPLSTKIFGRLINIFSDYKMRKISQDEAYKIIDEFTVYFVLLFVGCCICSYIYTALFMYTGERQARVIREEYFKSILRQNMGWFDFCGSGEITTRIMNDTLLVQDGISEKLALFIMNVSTAVAGFVIAFLTSWDMTLVLLGVMPFLALAVGLANRFGAIYTQKALDFYSQAGSIAEEVLGSIRTIVAFGAEERMVRKYESSLVSAEKAGIKKNTATGISQGAIFFVMFCSYALGFWYGGNLVADGKLGPGDVLNVFFAVLIGSFAIGHSAPDIASFSYAIGAGSALFEVIDRKPPIDSLSEEGEIPSKPAKGDIEFKNVRFQYPARQGVDVLKNVSIKVPAGKTVALVGSSGGGKSSIIQLIERFYDPTEGDILLDGKQLSYYNIRWLRSQIGLVSQEPTLFDGTIFQNVAFGLAGTMKENMPYEEKRKLIEDACKLANAHDFITKLPKGYETQVGEGGLLLSGGQKQRVAIARAVLKNAKILLLDEATSALDTASESTVQAALEKASEGRTTIVIAHRLSTVKTADKIIVMDKGQVLEEGTHKELMEKGGYYKRLVDAQRISSEQTESQPNDGITKATASITEDAIKATLNTSPLKIFEARASTYDDEFADEEGGGALNKKYPTFAVIRRIAKFNKPETVFVVIGAFSAVISGVMYPIFAIIFGNILEIFSTNSADQIRKDTIQWSLYFVYIAIVALFSNGLQGVMFGISGERLTTRIRTKLFETFLFQEIGYFDNESHTAGALASRLAIEATLVQGIAGISLGMIINIFLNIVGGVVVALVFGWELTLVILACLPLLVAAGAIRMKVLNGYTTKTKKAYQHSSMIASEAVAAVRTVHALTMEHHLMKRYHNDLEVPIKVGYQNAFVGSIAYAFSASINFLVNALGFWYGGRLIINDTYEIRNMFVVFMAILFGALGAGRVFSYAPDMSKAAASARAILNMFDRKPHIDARDDKGKPIRRSDVKGLMKFQDVSFTYPTRPYQVLGGVSLEVQPGQTAALVGASGSGKSSSLQLVERYYDPTKGLLSIDSYDLRELNLRNYRSHLALVGQEPRLYTGTVKENILLGYPENDPDYPPVGEKEVEKAAKDANIHDFIVSLPQGYDTFLGSKGGQLSGGQKQRIAIARALIRNPKVLLLDEATSALDGESEKVVQAALDNARQGRTTITIAHRLSTIQNADIIYVFQNGTIVESGTHEQLLQMKGVYYEMVKAQDLSHN